MPFDATPDQSIESRIIDEMLKLLGPDGENWIKGSGVDDRYCMLHALNLSKHNLRAAGDETELRIVEAIYTVYHRYLQIPDFNDDPERTFADVLDVLQLARTVRPSAAARELVKHGPSPPELVAMVQRAEREFQARRKAAICSEIGVGAGVLLLLIASICVPI